MGLALYPWQAPAVKQALESPGQRWIFGDETGLGKTAQCLSVAKALCVERILVICPALARQTWRQEITKWWPERFGSTIDETGKVVGVFYASPSRKTLSKKSREYLTNSLTASVRIVSPEVVDVGRERAFVYDPGANGRTLIILDEVHYYVNANTRRSQDVERILDGHHGPIVASSATPIPNRPLNLWNVLNLLWPGRFGFRSHERPVPYGFLDTYSERIYNGYSMVWAGLNPGRAEELKARLTHMLSRTTRKDVRQKWPGLLPSCQLRAVPVEPGRVGSYIEAWASSALSETSHIAILTNLRKTAAEIAENLTTNSAEFGRILHVDGSIPPEERNAKIAALRKEPSGVLVTTMHAVCEAISLSWCHRALLAELYWSPKTLVQVIGRFPRLDGNTDIVVDVLCGSDSVQAKMAVALADKLTDIGKVMPQAATDASLVEVFNKGIDEELLYAAIHAAGDLSFDEVMEDL